MAAPARSSSPKHVEEVDSQIAQIHDLIDELEAFAFQSERVLTRLDLRAAAQARHVARQLCTITPFLQLAIDEELRDAASIKVAELTTQARICLGRAKPEEKAVASQPQSGVRRRDDRRDPTRDAELEGAPLYRGATQPESAMPGVGDRPATEPDDVEPVSTASGVRVATIREGEPNDAAAARQWKSLLSR